MKMVFVFFIVLICVSFRPKTQSLTSTFSSERYYVPNEETALKIAEAIWLPIYGDDVLSEKPYKVALENDSIWVVRGTLPKGFMGGVAYIEINKKDCRILKVTHGK